MGSPNEVPAAEVLGQHNTLVIQLVTQGVQYTKDPSMKMATVLVEAVRNYICNPDFLKRHDKPLTDYDWSFQAWVPRQSSRPAIKSQLENSENAKKRIFRIIWPGLSGAQTVYSLFLCREWPDEWVLSHWSDDNSEVQFLHVTSEELVKRFFVPGGEFVRDILSSMSRVLNDLAIKKFAAAKKDQQEATVFDMMESLCGNTHRPK